MKKYFLLFALCISHHSSSMNSQIFYSDENNDEFEHPSKFLPEHTYSKHPIIISSPSNGTEDEKSIGAELSIEEYIKASFITPEMQCTYLQFFNYKSYEFNPQTLYSQDIPSLLYFFQKLKTLYKKEIASNIDNALLKYVVTHQDYDEPNNEGSVDITPTATATDTEIKIINKKSYIETIKKNPSGTNTNIFSSSTTSANPSASDINNHLQVLDVVRDALYLAKNSALLEIAYKYPANMLTVQKISENNELVLEFFQELTTLWINALKKLTPWSSYLPSFTIFSTMRYGLQAINIHKDIYTIYPNNAQEFINTYNYKKSITPLVAANLLFKQCLVSKCLIKSIDIFKFKNTQISDGSHLQFYNKIYDFYDIVTNVFNNKNLTTTKKKELAPAILAVRQAAQLAICIANTRSFFNFGSLFSSSVTKMLDGVVAKLSQFDSLIAPYSYNDEYGATQQNSDYKIMWENITISLATAGVIGIGAFTLYKGTTSLANYISGKKPIDLEKVSLAIQPYKDTVSEFAKNLYNTIFDQNSNASGIIQIKNPLDQSINQITTI
jgi:hypothetical protein